MSRLQQPLPTAILLAALWVVGIAAFSAIWWLPWLALTWTGVVGLLAAVMVGGMMFDLGRRSALLAQPSRPAVEGIFRSRPLRPGAAQARTPGPRWLQVDRLSDRGLRMQAAKSVALVADIAGHVEQLEHSNGSDEHLSRLLSTAHDMLALHLEAAVDADLRGASSCPFGREIVQQLSATARLLGALADGSASADASFSCDLATEQEESLARMRTAFRTVDDGAEEPLSSEGEMPTHLQRLSRNLHTNFSSISAQGGLKALAELDHQYQRLLPVLNEKRDTDPLGVSHIPALAEEAYRQGLNVLKDAFELAATVESSERQRLEREAIVLEVEIAALEEAGNAGMRLTMKQETAASHRERLEIISQHEWRVEELLHQCGRCEASLDRTRMELAVIKADSSVESVSAVTESLRRTIEQARSVRDELTRLGL